MLIHVEVKGYISQCEFMWRSGGIPVSVNSCGGQGIYESVLIHVEVKGYISQCSFMWRSGLYQSVFIHVEVRGYTSQC